jgi:hypothetical protein
MGNELSGYSALGSIHEDGLMPDLDLINRVRLGFKLPQIAVEGIVIAATIAAEASEYSANPSPKHLLARRVKRGIHFLSKPLLISSFALGAFHQYRFVEEYQNKNMSGAQLALKTFGNATMLSGIVGFFVTDTNWFQQRHTLKLGGFPPLTRWKLFGAMTGLILLGSAIMAIDLEP